MYNGIGLTTPRGSGTNGYVQRNFALVRHHKEKVDYKTEDEIRKMEASALKKPNQEILDHERKRKIELKCVEMEELMGDQGYAIDEIESKVVAFRRALMEQADKGVSKDEFGRPDVRETHQLAEANQEKNARLREAFGINQFYIDGSSLDPDRKAKEAAAQAAFQTKYDFVKESSDSSPSPKPVKKKAKKSKKKKSYSTRARSESPEALPKKAKSKKRKRDVEGNLLKKKDKKKKKTRKRPYSRSPLNKEKRKKRISQCDDSDSKSRDSSVEFSHRPHKSVSHRSQERDSKRSSHDQKKSNRSPPRGRDYVRDQGAVKEHREKQKKDEKQDSIQDYRHSGRGRSVSLSPKRRRQRGSHQSETGHQKFGSTATVSRTSASDSNKSQRSQLSQPSLTAKQLCPRDAVGSDRHRQRSKSPDRAVRSPVRLECTFRNSDKESSTNSHHEATKRKVQPKTHNSLDSRPFPATQYRRSSSSSSSSLGSRSRSSSAHSSDKRKNTSNERSRHVSVNRKESMDSLKNSHKESTNMNQSPIGHSDETLKVKSSFSSQHRAHHDNRDSSRSLSYSPATRRQPSLSPPPLPSHRHPSPHSPHNPVPIVSRMPHQSFVTSSHKRESSSVQQHPCPSRVSSVSHRSCSLSPPLDTRNGGKPTEVARPTGSPISSISRSKPHYVKETLVVKKDAVNVAKEVAPVSVIPSVKASIMKSNTGANMLRSKKAKSKSLSNSDSSDSSSSTSSSSSSSASSSGSKSSRSSSSSSSSDEMTVKKNTPQKLAKSSVHNIGEGKDKEDFLTSPSHNAQICGLLPAESSSPPQSVHRECTLSSSPSVQTIPLPPTQPMKSHTPLLQLPIASKWEKEDISPPQLVNKPAVLRSGSSSKKTKRMDHSRSPGSHSPRKRRTRSRTISRSISRSPSNSKSSRSPSRSSSRSRSRSSQPQRSCGSAQRSRSPSIPRRRGSPSFLDKRRITSARKRPIPYHRPSPPSSLSSWSNGFTTSSSRSRSQSRRCSSSSSRKRSLPSSDDDSGILHERYSSRSRSYFTDSSSTNSSSSTTYSRSRSKTRSRTRSQSYSHSRSRSTERSAH